MTLRDFFNGILQLIGSSSLTDLEYQPLSGTPGYTQANYDQLASVLQSRGDVSTDQERLVAYFKARGIDVAPLNTGKSNIYLGSALC